MSVIKPTENQSNYSNQSQQKQKNKMNQIEQEILKNLQAVHSLSSPSPPPPSPFPKEKRFNFSSSWFLVTCYGQFALPVCKELNVCMQLENFVCL